MKPDISEFSYGYALTESLVTNTGIPVIGSPLFPSLIAEGQEGGGYDVAIPFVGTLLFLQFKLSDKMIRNSAIEVVNGALIPPFYRMHIRASKHSEQHAMLLDLEGKGNLVFYAAPKFNKPSELNSAYLERKMIERSFFRKPSQIGAFTDDGPHHVSFRDGYPICICSEVKMLDERPDDSHKTFLRELEDRATHEKYEDSRLAQVAQTMIAIVNRRLGRTRLSADQVTKLQEQNVLAQIQYLSRTFFDCEALVVRLRPELDDGNRSDDIKK